MCIKPSVVQEAIVDTNPSDCIKSLVVAEPTTNYHRIKTMPKKYHPYQVSESKRKERGPKIVCKNVGSNGTIFIVQDDDDDNSNLSSAASTGCSSDIIDENIKQEEDVDVETVNVIGDQNPLSPTPFVLSAKVQEVHELNNKTLKQELLESPSDDNERVKNNGNQGLKQELLETPTSYRRNGSLQTKPPQPAGNTSNNPAGTVAFVAILLHALTCSNCEKPACRKMIMVLKHYKQCAFKRNSSLTSGLGWSASIQNCKICGQLLRIVAQHAKSDCQIPANQMGCPVLMCDTFRRGNAAAAVAAKQMNRAAGNLPELKVSASATRMPPAVRRNRMTQQPV